MATDQVLQWMNRDLKLSQPVHSFETDFANGYLFGEILVQYGVYEDIKIFSKKTNKEAKVNNFYKIEEAMRFLKVRFDAKMTHNIMQEERGAALRLLYQLKLAIEKREGPQPDQLEFMTTTGLKQGTVDKLLKERMDKTIANANTIKPQTVGGKDVRSEKMKRQDAHLAQFHLAMATLFEDAQHNDSNEKNLISTLQQKKRADNRNKLAENQEFMKEWEDEGHANWQENQTKRAANIARQKYFEDREVGIYKTKLNNELIGATREMASGFSEFEKNLQKLGIEQNTNMEDAIKRQEEKAGIPPGQIQNFSFPATMNKIKETKKQSDFAGKERERRRRKLAVDQATTQARLDKQKTEDMLIEKLLKRENEEQKQALIDERMRKCKAMQIENRRQKAVAIGDTRDKQMKEIEEKRVAEVKSNEANRFREILDKKKEYAAVRKDQKKARRRVNLEIASGIVDLIMDLSEETFHTQNTAPGRKLKKEQWREFMDVFKTGKKVSLRKIVKKVAQTDADEAAAGSLAITGNESVTDLLHIFKTEPSLDDFLQFISGSGMFNLSQINESLWKQVSVDLKIETFTENGSLRSNQHLGQMVESLYTGEPFIDGADRTGLISVQNQQEFAEKKSSMDQLNDSALKSKRESQLSVKSALVAPAGIPSGLHIKLSILGRAFSGKRTIAKQIQEKVGDKSITIFSMDDIIQEALEYVAPKKVDDSAADLKKVDKKKQPAKGAAADDTNVSTDKFEGKNSEEYKAIASTIKNQFFTDYEGELTQKKDLVTLVPDDNLLVALFIERLKLEYAGINMELDMEEIEAGVKKEGEIEAQLAEMEPAEKNSADPVAKGKPDKKAKGGDKKAPDEVLKEELETIRGLKMKGWILLDFPENLTQMKLLESALSKHQSQTDLPKSEDQAMYEAWSKVVSPAQLTDEVVHNETRAISSGMDGIIILDTPLEECERRSNGRKQDPQTNTIYHMEDNPPGDPKIEERLTDYTDEEGDLGRIAKSSSRFNQNVESIKKWTQNFGLQAEDADYCQVQLDMVIKREEWKVKDEVFAAVEAKVDRIIAFRNNEYQQVRENVRKQLATKIDAAEVGSAEVNPEGTVNESIIGSAEKEAEEAALVASTDALGNIARSTEKMDDEGRKGFRTIDSKQKLLSEHGTGSVSHGGTSRSFAKSSKMLARVSEISDSMKKQKWEEMLSLYYGEGMQQFNLMRHLRQNVFKSLNDTQRQFINYLGRKNDMQRKINEFCESFNRFSCEFPELLDNDETKLELQNRIDILSQQLWEQIKARKDESMSERQSYMEGGWVQNEMANLCLYVAKLIEVEYGRFTTISAVVTGVSINEANDLQELVKRLQERGMDSYIDNKTKGSYGVSPVLNDIASTILTKVESLFNEQFVLSLDKNILDVLNTERANFTMRMNTLFCWAILILDEIQQQANRVFDVLDDWIVIAVKQENQACQAAVKEITKLITVQGERTMDPVLLDEIDLMSSINQIEFEQGPPLYMNDVKPTENIADLRFSMESLQSLYKQFRKNKCDVNLIDSQTFVTMIIVNMQAGLLPNAWRFVSFDSIKLLLRKFYASPLSDTATQTGQVALFRRHSSKGLVDREYVSWRMIFTFLLLISGPLPTTDQKYQYFEALKNIADEETGLIECKKFVKIPSWFDRYEGMTISPSRMMTVSGIATELESIEEEDDMDKERCLQIKELMFKTYRVPNQQGLCVSEFVADLTEIFAGGEEGTSLYQTVLNL